MQLPDILNSNNLFLKLNGLSHGDNQTLVQVKDEILSRGTSALLHLIRLQDLNSHCLQEFKLYEPQLTNIKDDRIVFSSESLGYLLNEISPLLGTLRLLQNLSIKLVKALGTNSLPKSINDYVKNPEPHKLNTTLHNAIINHWESKGKDLKDYRDIDQHYQWLTSRYFIQLSPDRTILIEFPDNPADKSPKNFTYLNKINGLTFINESFKEIHELIEFIADFNGAKPNPHQQGVSMNQLGDLRPFSNRTISFMYSNYLKLEREKTTLHLEGIGFDQIETGQLSIRKYFLDEENLKKAKRLYRV